MRTRVGLPIRRDVGMAEDRFDWVRGEYGVNKQVQRAILGVGERFEIGSFKFDADRKIVAMSTAVEYRSACVPRALRARYELHRLPIAIDQYVRRYTRADDMRKKWVGRNVQRIVEEPLDMPAAVAAGWQADVVDDDQLDRTARRACIEVRRVDTANFIQPAVGADDHLMPSRCIRYRSCRNVMPRSCAAAVRL